MSFQDTLQLIIGIFILIAGILIFYASNRLWNWRLNLFSFRLNHEWVGGILFFLGMMIIIAVIIANFESKYLINL
jgi:hypothetical protein